MASFTVEDFSLNRLQALKRAEIVKRCNSLLKQTHFPP